MISRKNPWNYKLVLLFCFCFRSVRSNEENIDAISQSDTHIWSHVFKTTVHLIRQLYTRDTRRQFCPDDHWINDRVILPLDRPNDISFRRSRLRQYRPFQGLRVFTREELGIDFSSVFYLIYKTNQLFVYFS